MVAGMKETNKICKRRSRLWSGYCLVSERCDRQYCEVERAVCRACHGQGSYSSCLLVQKECRGEYESGLLSGLGQGVGYNVDLVLIQVMK
ncbi:putative gamma-thionin, partial [Tanacetum coccineum]